MFGKGKDKSATTAQYSDEKIFIDATARDEKEAVTSSSSREAGSVTTYPEKEAAVSDAPEAVKPDVRHDAGERVALQNDRPKDAKTLSLLGRNDALQSDGSEKQLVSPDTVSSPVDQPPSYVSPIQASSTSLFPTNQSRSYREYSFYHAAPWRPTHNTIADPENCARYFIEVSEFSKGKQDVALHDVRSNDPHFAAKRENIAVEEGKSCPVVAFVQYPHGTNDQVRIGVGSPEQMGTVRWVQMDRDEPEGHWCMLLGAGKKFQWRAGRSNSTASATAASDTSGTPTMGTSHFVEIHTGDAIAEYTEMKIGRSVKKRGKLRMYETAVGEAVKYEKDIELLIMLSIAAMNEKRRRKTWKKWALLGAG